MVDAGPEPTYEALNLSLMADIFHKRCEIGFVQIGNIGISLLLESWGTVSLRFPTLDKTTGIPSQTLRHHFFCFLRVQKKFVYSSFYHQTLYLFMIKTSLKHHKRRKTLSLAKIHMSV